MRWVLDNYTGNDEAWAHLKSLTAEEAAAVKKALTISGAPYDFYDEDSGRGSRVVGLVSESKAQENRGSWLVWCREAEESERPAARLENIAVTSQSDDLHNKRRAIEMARQFAELVRGKLGTTQNGEGKQVAHCFEVFDVDTSQSVVFDATESQHWGPEGYDKDWNGDYWNYWVEETLYRHPSGHWTMISEETHCEAPCSCGADARRVGDATAVDWLIRHGYDPPADVANLATNSYYKPGLPQSTSDPTDGNCDKGKPKWDEERRELCFDGAICKRFRQPAPNQTRILAAFEECGWPPKIDDPIPPSGGVNPCERLADTVRALNKGCDGIRFERDGTTEGVIWSAKGTVDEASPSTDIPF